MQLHDVVQLLIKQTPLKDPATVDAASDEEDKIATDEVMEHDVSLPPTNENTEEPIEEPCESKYYKIGDLIDFVHCEYGSWFEGKIVGILKQQTCFDRENLDESEENLRFQIVLEGYAVKTEVILF